MAALSKRHAPSFLPPLLTSKINNQQSSIGNQFQRLSAPILSLFHTDSPSREATTEPKTTETPGGTAAVTPYRFPHLTLFSPTDHCSLITRHF
jgi:hypothetical protein